MIPSGGKSSPNGVCRRSGSGDRRRMARCSRHIFTRDNFKTGPGDLEALTRYLVTHQIRSDSIGTVMGLVIRCGTPMHSARIPRAHSIHVSIRVPQTVSLTTHFCPVLAGEMTRLVR